MWFITMERPLPATDRPLNDGVPERRMTKNGNLERVMRLANIKGQRTRHVNHVTWDRTRVTYIKLEQGVYKVSTRVYVPLPWEPLYLECRITGRSMEDLVSTAGRSATLSSLCACSLINSVSRVTAYRMGNRISIPGRNKDLRQDEQTCYGEAFSFLWKGNYRFSRRKGQ